MVPLPRQKPVKKGQVCFGRFYLGKRKAWNSLRRAAKRLNPILEPIILLNTTLFEFTLIWSALVFKEKRFLIISFSNFLKRNRDA